jgi:HK97 family phage prohead protease
MKAREEEKNVYIEGYASSAIEDIHGERLSREAIRLAASEITKEPYNKLFLNHAPLRRDATAIEKIPIGRIIYARPEGEKLWIQAVLNSSHPLFETVSQSIKNGFLNAFSMGFRVLKRVGKLVMRIQPLEVSLVGVPVNPQAVVTDVYAKGVFFTSHEVLFTSDEVDFKVFEPQEQKATLKVELEDGELKIF